MKPILKTWRAVLLLAASLPLSTLLAEVPTPTPASATPLHEIGADPDPAPVAAPVPPPPLPTLPPIPVSRHHRHGDDDDGNRVAVGDSAKVAAGEVIPGNAVAVFGGMTVDGSVDGNSVSVFGASRIEGTVHGNVVVVFGTLRLGPNAHIDGNAVLVGGGLDRDPGAYVGGGVIPIGTSLNLSPDSGAASWWHRGFLMGRPLAFGPHLHALWFFSLCLMAIYAFLAMVFPSGTRKCGETLAHRPGLTILSGILGIIALPIIFILLLCTVVGIPIALIVLPLGIFGTVLFGKASIYSLVGRSLAKQPMHPALAALVGGAIFVAIYLIPFAGLAIWVIVAFLGFACTLATLLAPVKPVVPAAVAVAPGAPTPTVPAAAAAVPVIVLPEAVAPALPVSEAAPSEPAAAPVGPAVALAASAPPVISGALASASETALPRAGFWIRMAALAIDVILVGVVTQAHDIFLPALAAYGAILWKFKGATLGGIIFNMKVVRLDARPIDWPTAIVRALGSFISLVVIGLGFIWIAFDPEKQGWHDKIAGTVVVRVPKAVPLV
jgi:uncharacterized RDD family membrane protein YckC